MQDTEFRNLFIALLAFGAFCAALFTLTWFAEPGGIGMVFRLVVCAGLAVSFITLFVVDLIGIWTGDRPRWHKH